MVIVISGNDYEGKPCHFYMDENLKNNLDMVKEVVTKKDFDYVAIVAGLPGTGKSNFSINCAKYLDPNFTEDNIAFSAEEFVNITNNCPNNSAVILDESFASLNSKVTLTSDFIRVVNHLQLIRQKNLYIFLNLPNFFDLSKGIAIYRSSHLFVVYGEKFGDRGSFAAFDRDKKKELYILGQKFMNYLATSPNFRGRFVKQKAIDEEVYKNAKYTHLKSQEGNGVFSKKEEFANKVLAAAYYLWGMPMDYLEKITEKNAVTLYQRMAKYKDLFNQKGGKDNEQTASPVSPGNNN